MKLLRFSLAVAAAICSGCSGYRCERNDFATLTVPFVDGDRDGSLTQALIHEVTLHTPFSYVCANSVYELRVRLLDIREENIGFRYDRHKKGKLRHAIIPTELRMTALAEVTLYDATTGEVLIAPTPVEAYVDCDHDYYCNRDAVNVFSLGQLADIDAAREAALHPLNVKLARNVADFLACWLLSQRSPE